MRTPPLLAKFIQSRVCKPFCEKYLTLPDAYTSFIKTKKENYKVYCNDLFQKKVAELTQKEKEIDKSYREKVAELTQKEKEINKLYQQKIAELAQKEKETDDLYKKGKEYEEYLKCKISDIPSLAKISSDIEAARDQGFANYLRSKTRPALKTATEIEKLLKEEKRNLVQQLKEYQYKCWSYEDMFPYLEDYDDELIAIEADKQKRVDIKLDDEARQWISDKEYDQLSMCEKYQLALNRYLKHKKSNVEIGRDYERFIGYKKELEGWDVSFFGIHKGIEDLGRDLICKKDDVVMIIQCKCWSSKKVIHEKHINQLFGTTVMYYLEEMSTSNDLSEFYNCIYKKKIIPVFITSTVLSDTARNLSSSLGVQFFENIKLEEYPMIKCNINNSTKEKIYHLPFDQQYDSVRISGEGEFYAMTVREAENAGFRRAKRHIYN